MLVENQVATLQQQDPTVLAGPLIDAAQARAGLDQLKCLSEFVLKQPRILVAMLLPPRINALDIGVRSSEILSFTTCAHFSQHF